VKLAPLREVLLLDGWDVGVICSGSVSHVIEKGLRVGHASGTSGRCCKSGACVAVW